jgi:hypothetical protein
VPLPRQAEKFEYVVFGLNPGEQDKNWEEYKGPTKETIEFDWLDTLPQRTSSSKRWRKSVAYFCGERPAVTNDFFFWSTRNTGKLFEQRFGYRFLESPHFDFCRHLNLRMVDGLVLKAIVAPGLTHTNHFASLYGLEFREMVRAANGHRLIELYERKNVPWVFTKHWSGSFGFGHDQRASIRSYIAALG